MPNGGRNHRGATPVASATLSTARRMSSAACRGVRRSMLPCTSPCTPISCPASATARATPGSRRVISPSMKNVARHPSASSASRKLRRRLGVGSVVERERDVTLAPHTDQRGREAHADRRHPTERGRGVHHRDRGRSDQSRAADVLEGSRDGSAQLSERRGTQPGRRTARRGRPPRPPWPSGRGRDRRARRPCPTGGATGRFSGRTVKLATTSFCFWRCE